VNSRPATEIPDVFAEEFNDHRDLLKILDLIFIKPAALRILQF
jgi:hypothetical protein